MNRLLRFALGMAMISESQSRLGKYYDGELIYRSSGGKRKPMTKKQFKAKKAKCKQNKR